MEPPSRPAFDALLQESGWARRLARSLVRDPHAADDLVQRAWLAALRRPPQDGTPPRRWLASVLRNLARSDARESGRRRAREHEVARPTAVSPEVDDVEERIALQEGLLRAVRELPEPSRSTVWARYGEGLAPREIARRDGVPIKTVRTRLARGLETLRARFDREHGGDRKAWVALLVPLARPKPIAVVVLTTIVMDAKLKIAASLAIVVCGTGLWLATRDGAIWPGETGPIAPVASALEMPRETGPEVTDEPLDAPRVALGVAEPAPAAAPPTPVAVRTGIVVDLEKRPVAGLEIVDGWRHEPILLEGSTVTSDARGRFTVPSAESFGYVSARGPGWVSVCATQSPPISQTELCVVVARERSIAGTVVDSAGAPVANALVDQRLAESVRRNLGELMRSSVEAAFSARTGADGHFALIGAPDAEVRLDARAENHRAGFALVPSGPAGDVVIVLPAPEIGSIALRGRVVDAAGNGVDRAEVALETVSVKSAADGRFELAVPRKSLESALRTARDGRVRPLFLRAAKVGHLPCKQELPELVELERIAPTEEWRLALGGPPLSITGRVVDSDGRPVKEATIDVLDEEIFGQVDVVFEGSTLSSWESVEDVSRGTWSAIALVTDDDGRFVAGGLQPRDYRLDVTASTIQAASKTAPIRAGTSGLEIVLDTSGPRTDLAGRVVDRRGDSFGTVTVTVRVVIPGYADLLSGPQVLSDPEGRFACKGVRGSGFKISVDGSDLLSTTVDVEPGADLADLVVIASRRAFVQVDLGERADLADTARFFDAAGDPVQLEVTRTTKREMGSLTTSGKSARLKIEAGRTDVGSTCEGDYTCVLQKDGREVVRIPARLGGKGVTILRP